MIPEELAFFIPWAIGGILAVIAIIIFIKQLRKK